MTRDEPVAVRSPGLLREGALTLWWAKHGDILLSPAEANVFMKGRVAEWTRQEDVFRTRFSLREYTCMSDDELASWILTGIVPARVRRVWSLS